MQALWIRLADKKTEIIAKLQTGNRYSIMRDYDVHDTLSWGRCLDEKWGQKGKGYHDKNRFKNLYSLPEEKEEIDRLSNCIYRLQIEIAERELVLRQKELLYQTQIRNNGHKSGDVKLWEMMEA